MTIGGERGAVQNPFLRYAVEAGWTPLTREKALDLRRGITSPVLDSILVRQLQRLNPGIVDAARADELARQIARVRPSIEGNFDAWQYLKGVKTVFVPDEKREAGKVAAGVERAFEAHPHWQAGGAQEREVRKKIYKALIDADVDEVVDLASGLLRMLRRASE